MPLGHRSLSPDEEIKVKNADSLLEASDSTTECFHHIPARNFVFLSLIPVQHPPVDAPDSAHSTDADPNTKSGRRDSVSSSASSGGQHYLKLNPVQLRIEQGIPDYSVIE